MRSIMGPLKTTLGVPYDLLNIPNILFAQRVYLREQLAVSITFHNAYTTLAKWLLAEETLSSAEASKVVEELKIAFPSHKKFHHINTEILIKASAVMCTDRNKFWFHHNGNLYSLLVVLELFGRNSNWTRLSDPAWKRLLEIAHKNWANDDPTPAIARLPGAPEDPVTESADAIRANLIKLDGELEALDEAGGVDDAGEQVFANMQTQYCLAYCKERVLPRMVDWKYLEDALEECEENESTREMIKNHMKTPFWVNDSAGCIRLACFSPLKSE